MKRPIEWHKICLTNRRASLTRHEDELRIVRDRVNQLRFDIVIYDGQIQRAEYEKRDGFDADKFNKSRK
jgi:hypothetical protein